MAGVIGYDKARYSLVFRPQRWGKDGRRALAEDLADIDCRGEQLCLIRLLSWWKRRCT